MGFTELQPNIKNETLGDSQSPHLVGVMTMKNFTTILTALLLSLFLASCVNAPINGYHLREMRKDASPAYPILLWRIGKAFEKGAVVEHNDVHALSWYFISLRSMRVIKSCDNYYSGGIKYNSCYYPYDRWIPIVKNRIVPLRSSLPSDKINLAVDLADKCIESKFKNCPGDKEIFATAN